MIANSDQTKPTKPNLPNQTYQTNPTKPNQTYNTKPNLANQAYWTKPRLLVQQSLPGSVVPLAMFLHQFWCTQGTLLQTILVVIVGSPDLNPNDQQSTHIQLRAHRLNNTTVCSTVSIGILMRKMVVFGSWSQTLLIWWSSFYNSHHEYIVQYLDLHLCSLAIIWERRATWTDCIVGVPIQCNEFLSWLLN